MTILQFGNTSVEVTSSGTLIKFDDGYEVPGEPEDTDSYRETAQRYGYDADTLSLCIDHEIMHIALAHWLGIDSPTMEAIRHNRGDDNMPLRHLEEAAVLAIQQYARTCGISLIERFRTIG